MSKLITDNIIENVVRFGKHDSIVHNYVAILALNSSLSNQLCSLLLSQKYIYIPKHQNYVINVGIKNLNDFNGLDYFCEQRDIDHYYIENGIDFGWSDDNFMTFSSNFIDSKQLSSYPTFSNITKLSLTVSWINYKRLFDKLVNLEYLYVDDMEYNEVDFDINSIFKCQKLKTFICRCFSMVNTYLIHEMKNLIEFQSYCESFIDGIDERHNIEILGIRLKDKFGFENDNVLKILEKNKIKELNIQCLNDKTMECFLDNSMENLKLTKLEFSSISIKKNVLEKVSDSHLLNNVRVLKLPYIEMTINDFKTIFSKNWICEEIKIRWLVIKESSKEGYANTICFMINSMKHLKSLDVFMHCKNCLDNLIENNTLRFLKLSEYDENAVKKSFEMCKKLKKVVYDKNTHIYRDGTHKLL